MKVNIEDYRNCEVGSVAILGNGPSLNHWNLSKLSCPTIGINLSTEAVLSDYFVTVAKDRAQDVNEGKITAKKAVITHREIDPSISQSVLQVSMPLPDTYGVHADTGLNIFNSDLTLLLHKTFGGMLATQAAIFLGYTRIYLLGIDGGVENFSGTTRGDSIPASYHRKCFWHLYDWWRDQMGTVRIYQTNPDSAIDYFPVKSPPIKMSKQAAKLKLKAPANSKEHLIIDAAIDLSKTWSSPISAKMIQNLIGDSTRIETINKWLQHNSEIFEKTIGLNGEKFYVYTH